MNVLVAMSGGVDSSVAAARLVAAGHDVTGVTMKLWGGESDTGCCSVADVDDARRVANQLGIDHLVFSFGDDFMTHVVDPYVAAHAAGRTPNPCIECNRHLKFDRLLNRADALGFDAVATGHHARIRRDGGPARLARGADRAKDQSYVLYPIDPSRLEGILLPVGDLTKAEVRAEATRLGLRTAGKPDSQDVCFITASHGRRAFLGDRIELRPARLVDRGGHDVGTIDALELVTVGQRRGLGLAGDAEPRFALEVDAAAAVVTVGTAADLLDDELVLGDLVWSAVIAAGEPADGARPPALGDRRPVAQCGAHGETRPCAVLDGPERGTVVVRWSSRQRRVAPGQSVVLYDGDEVLGGGIVV
jgi:tRNA-uridine 2-sulfurtransferase